MPSGYPNAKAVPKKPYPADKMLVVEAVLSPVSYRGLLVQIRQQKNAARRVIPLARGFHQECAPLRLFVCLLTCQTSIHRHFHFCVLVLESLFLRLVSRYGIACPSVPFNGWRKRVRFVLRVDRATIDPQTLSHRRVRPAKPLDSSPVSQGSS